MLYLPFEIGALLREFRLSDHYQLIGNMADMLLKKRDLVVTAPSTIQVTAFEAEGKYVIHLINETGERPLRETLPVYDLEVEVKLPEGYSASSVRTVIEEQEMTWEQEGDYIVVKLAKLDVWEMLVVEF